MVRGEEEGGARGAAVAGAQADEGSRGLPIREIAKRTGHDRDTVRRALRREGPLRYERPTRPSKLDPFKDEITACCGTSEYSGQAAARADLGARLQRFEDDRR